MIGVVTSDRHFKERMGRRKSLAYNLDKKDAKGGYSIDNCVPCCADCNRTKSNHITYDLMIKLGRTIKAEGGWEATNAN